MNDRNWMLNPSAIRSAKECIQLVKKELGVKLLLSHPEFIQMLHEYVELTESQELNTAYGKLVSFAGAGNVIKSLKSKEATIVEFKANGTDAAPSEQETTTSSDDEMVTYGNKQFPRWREGKEFSGLYRGQPNYT